MFRKYPVPSLLLLSLTLAFGVNITQALASSDGSDSSPSQEELLNTPGKIDAAEAELQAKSISPALIQSLTNGSVCVYDLQDAIELDAMPIISDDTSASLNDVNDCGNFMHDFNRAASVIPTNGHQVVQYVATGSGALERASELNLLYSTAIARAKACAPEVFKAVKSCQSFQDQSAKNALKHHGS